MAQRVDPRSELPQTHPNRLPRSVAYLSERPTPKLRFLVAWEKYRRVLERSEQYHSELRRKGKPALRITLSFTQFLANHGYNLRGGVTTTVVQQLLQSPTRNVVLPDDVMTRIFSFFDRVEVARFGVLSVGKAAWGSWP